MAQDQGIVLVTGASGFLASHVILQLLKRGYSVRGTVRHLSNERKTKPLFGLCPEAEHKLQIVECDLLDPGVWRDAVKDCVYVIHMASPVPVRMPQHEDELIRPALDGTMNVLKAAKEAGTVKRVVLTSSGAAITGPNSDLDREEPFTEADWNENTSIPYRKSKTVAEKAAWDFVKALPEDNKFELVVLNPVIVFGPALFWTGDDVASLELPKKMLNGAMPFLARLSFCVVDVRDVAEAHVAAMTASGAAGSRHILCTGNIWWKDMAALMEKEFGPQGYNMPSRVIPDFLVRAAGWFSKWIYSKIYTLGKEVKYSNIRMKEVLGIQPRGLNETIIDMCYSLIDHGVARKTDGYRVKDE